MSLVAATGIPSPSEGVWYLGPLPLRAYGIIIAIGMVVGVWWTARRYVARGGSSDTIYDVALWAIPLGVVGARLYHVVTSPEAYFGPGGDPMLAFQIWRGGLGIWGGVALGALGAYVGVKRAKVRFGPIADSLAPALLVAQGIGRWGNWFNQELFGGPTTLPWGLQIDAAHVPVGYPVGTLFHPTRSGGGGVRGAGGGRFLGGARPRPPLRGWTTLRDVPDGVHRGTRVDRDAAYRRRTHGCRFAPERVDVPGGIPPWRRAVCCRGSPGAVVRGRRWRGSDG